MKLRWEEAQGEGARVYVTIEHVCCECIVGYKATHVSTLRSQEVTLSLRLCCSVLIVAVSKLLPCRPCSRHPRSPLATTPRLSYGTNIDAYQNCQDKKDVSCVERQFTLNAC